MLKLFYFLIFINLVPCVFTQHNITEHIARGDDFNTQFNNERVLEQYKLVYDTDSTNYEVLWRLARAHIDIGEVFDQKDDKCFHFSAPE